MDTAQLTIIASAITTTAAIIGPVLGSIVGSLITNHYSLKTKRLELNYPQLLDTLDTLTRCYRDLPRAADPPLEGINKGVPLARYYNFTHACHKILALTPMLSIRREITQLLSDLESANYYASAATDAKFSKILNSISMKIAKKL